MIPCEVYKMQNGFEEEEPVDLEVVSNELESLEGQISETDNTIEEFCKELNIKPPF